MTPVEAKLPIVVISQRVVVDPSTNERRDALDQRWAEVADALGCLLWPVPNDPDLAFRLVREVVPHGIILSGGNDVGTVLGRHTSVPDPPIALDRGDAPERDRTETILLDWSCATSVPLVGVCRGMQALNVFWGGGLRPVDRATHVAQRHPLEHEPQADRFICDMPAFVNSYHARGVMREDVARPVVPLASYCDVVEAIAHQWLPQIGIMWHPEREAQLTASDLTLFRKHLRLAERLS